MMKQIKSIEQVALNGGAAASDCMSLLQYEVNTHQSSGNKDWEDAYWDHWSDRFYECIEERNLINKIQYRKLCLTNNVL